jgi:eukaryotic-like serine/threonine-protein kinase
LTKDHDDQLAELLLKWEEAWDLGNDIPASTLCADCPELTQKLNDQIRLLKSMNWMKKDASDELAVPNEVDLLIGKTLAGRYRIDSIVGSGGHGKVYKSFDPELQRDVAVKVSLKVASDRQSDELLEEARRAAKLKHPNIVAAYDGQLFFVTELVDGKNLADIIADSKPSISEAKRIITSVAEALDFAHQQGFLHRDIKPANILLDTNGRVMVTDFGIATTIDKIQNHRGGTPGTLPYMAPEQIAGEVQLIDGRTDVHALGVVLYELLTGQLPYQGRTPTAVREQILLRQPKPLYDMDDSIPKHLEDVCLKCLSKHPADRFGTAAEFARALQQNLSEQPKSVFKFKRLLAAVAFGISLVAVGYIAGSANSSKLVTSKIDGGIVFDGTRRIITPLTNFAPVTIEAWIAPMRTSNVEDQFVVGSDVPGHYGLGIGIKTNGHPMVETVRGGAHATRYRFHADRWSHLAAVYDSEETRLYLNGKLVTTCDPTKQPEVQSPFVIGSLGVDQGTMCFQGKLKSVRISTGIRFKEDFLPDNDFNVGDRSDALLIYDESSFSGDKIIDLSGNRNHGKWDSVLVSQDQDEQDRKIALMRRDVHDYLIRKKSPLATSI